MWLLFGSGRMAAVARFMQCTRQNVEQFKTTRETPDHVKRVMCLVERQEMQYVHDISTNILRAAKLTHHADEAVRKKAAFDLILWADIYAVRIKELENL